MTSVQQAGGPSRPVKRACDQCHVKKVKCNGRDPCETCQRTELSCSFLKPVLPKGPLPSKFARRRQDSPGRRISRSSSPIRRPRDTSLQTWTPASWEGPGSSLDLSGPFDYNLSDWTSRDTDGASKALQDLWDEFCAGANDQAGRPSDPPLDTRSEVNVNAYAEPVQGQSNSCAPSGTTALDNVTAVTPARRGPSQLDMFTQTVFTPKVTQAPGPEVGNFSFLGFEPSASSSLPWSMPFSPPEEVSPILVLTLDTLIVPQLEVFFERIYPMIPIFPHSYIFGRLSDVESHQNRSFVSLLLAMASLALIHPLKPEELASRTMRAKQSKILMDEVLRLRSKWDWTSYPSVEGATASYLMFGTMFELADAGSARMRLREAIGIGELLKLDTARAYMGVEPDEARRRMRLFWVLGVTERAYALQRSGSIAFQGSLYLPSSIGLDPAQDLASRTLLHLARLFSFVNPTVIGCWNGKCDPTTCKAFTKDDVVTILRALKGTPTQVFGSDITASGLNEMQQADLLITWQWLRNRVWRLAASHGLVCNAPDEDLGVDYVVDVARTTVVMCRRFSSLALEAHGCGFVEKLYDIASIGTELVQTSPRLQTAFTQVAKTEQWTDLVQSLHAFVSQHRSGLAFVQPMAQAISAANEIKLLCAM